MSDFAEKLENDRREKLAAIRAAGFDPYGDNSNHPPPMLSTSIANVRGFSMMTNHFPTRSNDEAKEGPWYRVFGRVISKNNKGKLKFFHIKDVDSTIQIMFSASNFAAKEWELLQNLEVNDIIYVSGVLIKTNSGELTIYAENFGFSCKSLALPAEKFHGVKDDEIKIRKRYLDMIQSPDLNQTLQVRSNVIRTIRQNLWRKQFIEVETPILTNQALGAAAKPFVTHHNALDIPLFLRIAPELHLKRYLVGGFTKIFEIGKVFRNEGVDRTHNPEFTILELYEAYADVDAMKVRTIDILVDLWPQFKNCEFEHDQITYRELFQKHLEFDVFDEEAVRKLKPSTDHWKAVDELFDEHIQPHLSKPTFVFDFPRAMCPLAKPVDDKVCDRFELFIEGMEIANAYSELNDPDLQLENFKKQGSEEAIDHDFIEALMVGMPHAGGLGIGIDRLVMLLTGSQSIRDVIGFPLVRPKS